MVKWYKCSKINHFWAFPDEMVQNAQNGQNPDHFIRKWSMTWPFLTISSENGQWPDHFLMKWFISAHVWPFHWKWSKWSCSDVIIQNAHFLSFSDEMDKMVQSCTISSENGTLYHFLTKRSKMIHVYHLYHFIRKWYKWSEMEQMVQMVHPVPFSQCTISRWNDQNDTNGTNGTSCTIFQCTIFWWNGPK